VGRQQCQRWGVWARRRGAALVLTSFLTGGFVGLTAAPAGAAAALTLSPNQGTAGSTFSISGSGFAASEHIKFTWDDPNGSQIASQVTVSIGGSFSNVQATAPADAAPADHTVYASGTGAGFPSQATATYKVVLPPGGGTTSSTRPPTTTTTHPAGTTTTTAIGNGITPTTAQHGGSTPTTRNGGSTSPTAPSGSTTATVAAGPVDVQAQTDVLGESLNDGTTTTIADNGSHEDALGPQFPAVKSGGGCSACWGAVAVLLGGVGTVALVQQKKMTRRRAYARRRRF
jgi:hypothetical protein